MAQNQREVELTMDQIEVDQYEALNAALKAVPGVEKHTIAIHRELRPIELKVTTWGGDLQKIAEAIASNPISGTTTKGTHSAIVDCKDYARVICFTHKIATEGPGRAPVCNRSDVVGVGNS